MSAARAIALLGKRAEFSPREPHGLTFEVEIVDVKEAYGRTRYLVRPVTGYGETWTESLSRIAE